MIRDAGAATAAIGIAASPALARIPHRPSRPSRNRVAILGGGMAGLAAAHELAERGFRVSVYERNAWGGKARSIAVPGTAAGGRKPLPGEHGFRFFPGFYHHVPDSMRKIPYRDNPNGVWDNLIAATGGSSPRTEGRADGQIFGIIPDPAEARTPEGLIRILTEVLSGKGVPPDEAAFFATRIVVFLTSSDERRFGQWEYTSWREFVEADGKSDEYQRVVSQGLTRTVVAAKESVASSRTIGNMAEAFIYNIMGRGNDGALDRVLNGPTNEVWIDPWVNHLRGIGVRFHDGQSIRRLNVKRGRIESALATDRHDKTRRIDADWFVSAMPAERARELLSRDVLALDPSLEGMHDLFVDWMVGIQYYLKRPLELTHGHLSFIDAQWALTALTQAQFWEGRDFAASYGDGSVVDCLSVDISDWDTPGMVYDKPAKLCKPRQVAEEVWEQIKAHLNDNGEVVLDDEIAHSWFIDPCLKWVPGKGRNRNGTPLLVNTVGTWEKRPEAKTEIPNLFMAGDFVQTNVDLATMEGANEAGRYATNALLDAAGSRAEPAATYKLYRPPEFEAVKVIDAARFKAGQPNLLDP